MDKLEIAFFEEYKYVDNICSDMYGSQPGVTAYINEMERLNHQGVYKVQNWKAKLQTLKRLRRLRNDIAHSQSVTDLNEYDISELERFHNQLLNQKDPLSELRKATKGGSTPPKQVIYKTPQFDIQEDDDDDEISSSVICLIIVAGCVIAGLFLLFGLR